MNTLAQLYRERAERFRQTAIHWGERAEFWKSDGDPHFAGHAESCARWAADDARDATFWDDRAEREEGA